MYKIICKFLKEWEDSLNLRQFLKDFVLGFFGVREEVKVEDDKGMLFFFCDDYFVNFI